jgi:hypothetical protein
MGAKQPIPRPYPCTGPLRPNELTFGHMAPIAEKGRLQRVASRTDTLSLHPRWRQQGAEFGSRHGTAHRGRQVADAHRLGGRDQPAIARRYNAPPRLTRRTPGAACDVIRIENQPGDLARPSWAASCGIGRCTAATTSTVGSQGSARARPIAPERLHQIRQLRLLGLLRRSCPRRRQARPHHPAAGPAGRHRRNLGDRQLASHQRLHTLGADDTPNVLGCASAPAVNPGRAGWHERPSARAARAG